MRRIMKPFPVGDDFFAPLLVPIERLNSLRNEVRTALNNALAECQKLQTSRESTRFWKVQARVDGLSAFARVRDLAPTTSSLRVCGTMAGSYKAIARFFKTETREQYFNVQKSLFPDTVDAAVLHTVEQYWGRESESEGVKWAAHSPAWHRKAIDGCVFESTGISVDSNGRPFSYCVAIPTSFPEVPNLYATKRSARVQSVMIFSPSAHDESYSNVFVAMRSDRTTRRTSKAFHKQLLTGLHGVGVASSKQQARSFVFHNGKWVLSDPHGECDVCSRGFSMFGSKHRCSLCDNVVCWKCLVQGQSIRLWRGARAGRDSRPTKACKPCVERLCNFGSLLTDPLSGYSTAWEAVTPTISFHHELHLEGSTTLEPHAKNQWDWVTPRLATEITDRLNEEPDPYGNPVNCRVFASPLQHDDFISPTRTLFHADDMSRDQAITCPFTHEERRENTMQDTNAEEDGDMPYDVFASGKSVFFTMDMNENAHDSSPHDDPSSDGKIDASLLLIGSIRSSLRAQKNLLQQLQQATGGHTTHPSI